MNSTKTKTLMLSAAIGLSLMSANTQADEQPNRFGIGLFADNSLSIYDGHADDNELKMSGGINFQYRGENFNLDENTASYKFFDNDKYNIEIIGAFEDRGYQASESKKLLGMDNRSNSVGLGGRLSTKTNLGTVSLAATGDVSNKHKGKEVDLKVSQGLFRKGPKGEPRSLSVELQAGVKWQSDDVVDYYYGVKSSEATATRAAYSGQDAITPYVGVTARTNLMERVTFDVGMIYKHYPDEISKSPIVDKDHDLELKTGLTYWF
ncbi:MAG: MipA/OmpV family protein [Leucothrix sp.]